MAKKLFVGGLSWNTTDDGLRGAFEQFGEIGKIFSSVVYEIISRLENIPALKCD